MKGPILKEFIDASTVARRVSQVGAQISRDFGDEPLYAVGVLKGAFIFLADLVRSIRGTVYIDFIAVSSYVGKQSTGRVRIIQDLSVDIKGKNVLVVEDIIDTGVTMDYLLELLAVRQPKRLKVCALLSKPTEHKMHKKIDYCCFEVASEFLVGYGLDLDGRFRHLPYIAQVQK